MKVHKHIIKYSFLLLIVFAFSCEDVEIENFNDPDLSATLSNADDYPSILNGAYLTWWSSIHKYSPYMTLSVAADHGSSSWGNFNMRGVGTVGDPYGLGNHSALNNTQSAPYTAYLETPWYNLYSAISTANDVLFGINVSGNLVNGDETTTENTKAQALFIRGLSYGYLGLLFDQGFIVTEETDLETVDKDALVPYSNLINQAISDLTAVLTISSTTGSFSISQFNGLNLDTDAAERLTNSYLAKILAHSARTSAESASLNWTTIKEYAENGINADFAPLGDGGTDWWHAYFLQGNSGWIRVDQKIVNMAAGTNAHPFPFPESGAYDNANTGILDNRFGESSDKHFQYAGSAPFRPNRGIYFFSYYKFQKYNSYRSNLTLPMVSLPKADNDLILAEAILRTGGDLNQVASLINNTRVGQGNLSPANSTDSDLMEKIFYERYLSAYESPGGPFFDRRRTDDLGSAQFTQFPIPALELNTLGIPLYTFGGN